VLGVITGRDVIRNGWTIVREFGPAAYGRCVLALVTRRPSTFLAVVTAPRRPAPGARRAAAFAAVAALASAGLLWQSEPVQGEQVRCGGCEPAMHVQVEARIQ
jgi:hypothetical protein